MRGGGGDARRRRRRFTVGPELVLNKASPI
jgi:hypothetical protein